MDDKSCMSASSKYLARMKARQKLIVKHTVSSNGMAVSELCQVGDEQ